MPGSIKDLSLLLMAWIPGLILAQQVSLNSQDMEDLLYRNESAFIPDTPGDGYSVDSLTLDLNSASVEDLEASGLFTTYQIHMLLEYLEKFGPIYSIYELAAIPGFRHGSFEKIKSAVSLNKVKIPKGKNPGQHMIMLSLERIFPGGEAKLVNPNSEAKADYTGSMLRSTLRIRSHPWRKISMAMTYEKDAGELFLYQNRPQFLSGYLSYKGDRFIKHVVLGNFKMNQGVGLVNGDGFMHRVGDFRVNQLSMSKLKPYASLTETKFEQGVACKMDYYKFQLQLWASYRKISLSPKAIEENPETNNWLDYQRTSGLFRTKAELEARELAYRIHYGVQLLFRHQRLSAGVLYGCEWVGLSKKAMVLLKEKPVPTPQPKVSLHGNWYKRKIQIFGEFSLSELHSLAFLLGTQYHFNDFVQGSLLIHHYEPGYQGSLPSSYASGSHISNEQGIAFHLHMETGKNMTARLAGEVFRYPSPRYLTNVPSGGYRLDLSLQSPGNKTLQWRARVVSKTWQTSPAEEKSKIRPLLDSRVSRIDGQLIYKHHDRFRWQSRLVISHFSQKQTTVPGYATLQQVTIAPLKYFKATAQFVLFHVSNWENRIYLYEPGFYYSFSFPAYYGSGQKTTLLLTIKPTNGVSVSAKISSLINRGNREWETGIQLRLKL